jgi:ribonucleoside-diphosphate reductase beta chain
VKHTEFFRLVLNAIGEKGDLSHLHSKTYRKIYYEILPNAMDRLWHDQSPEAIADAATVYNMFAEAMLAEMGYRSFYELLHNTGKMSGIMEGIGYLKKDEARHIGYGTFLLQRSICEHPHLFDRVVKKLAELAPLARSLSAEGLHGMDKMKFDIRLSEVKQFLEKQFRLRIEILARAKGKTLQEIYHSSDLS